MPILGSAVRISNKVRVKNKMGLHTRPAMEIVKLLQNCKSQVTFTYRKASINAKSILGILMLAAKKNSMITVYVDGEDAAETMDKIKCAFACGFGE